MGNICSFAWDGEDREDTLQKKIIMIVTKKWATDDN
jgi:hypothetical protein